MIMKKKISTRERKQKDCDKTTIASESDVRLREGGVSGK